MAYQSIPAGNASIQSVGSGLALAGGALSLDLDTETALKVDARSKLGTSALAAYFTHLNNKGGMAAPGIASTGTCGFSSAGRGEIVVSSGATAGGLAALALSDTIGGTYPPSIGAGTGASWYWAAKLAVTTAIDAQTECDIAAGGSSQSRMGVHGATSTLKYVAKFDSGSALVSTVSIDTAYHVLKAWRVGGLTYFSVDGETPVTGNTFPSAGGVANLLATNGSTAANRSMTVDYFISAAPEA